jgi:hypothetical protein
VWRFIRSRDEDDVPFAVQQLRQAVGRHLAAVEIVRRDVARKRNVGAREAGVEDDDRDLLDKGLTDGHLEGAGVKGGEAQGVVAVGHERLDDLDLLTGVAFPGRSLPNDLHVRELGVRLARALLHGFPEFVGRALGDDGDAQRASRSR